MVANEGNRTVCAFIIERGIDPGCDIELFWHEDDAVEAARSYLARWWPREEMSASVDVHEAIEAANQIVGKEEFLVLDQLSISRGRDSDGTW